MGRSSADLNVGFPVSSAGRPVPLSECSTAERADPVQPLLSRWGAVGQRGRALGGVLGLADLVHREFTGWGRRAGRRVWW